MKLQSIPDCISICGIKFKIEQVSCVNKGDGGYTLGKIDFSTDVIQLDVDLPEDKKLQVLIHETLQAVFELTGNQEIGDDEKTLQGVATVLDCLVKENKLLSFLCEEWMRKIFRPPKKGDNG